VKLKKRLLAFSALLLLSTGLFAKELFSEDFGDYRVLFSVFNSTFITPQVATAYQLTRNESQAFVNVALTKKISADQYSLGKEAIVKGSARNLLGQSFDLKFKTIKEGEGESAVTYYLAALPHSDEEVFHFDIKVSPADSKRAYPVKFTRKLYVEK